jgi:hypothetical protein
MIHYCFQIKSGKTLHFDINPERVYSPEEDKKPHADWTVLGFKQCTNCPLSKDQFRHCPVAVDLQNIISDFSAIVSFETATVVVSTPNREIRKECDVQTGLNSMMGLVMATSGCPILAHLKNLANFHLPFSTYEDTLFRTVGGYLIKQYFINKRGGKPDLELKGLDQFYRDLGTVNSCFVERINAAVKEDASANAVVLYWSISSIVNASLDDQLNNEKKLFAPDV